MPKIELKIDKACIKRGGKWACRHIPHGLNRVLGMHWAVRAAWKKAWEEQVAIAVLENRSAIAEAKENAKTGRPKVWVRYRGFSPQDRDNATGGIKPLLDGLVKAGAIQNDDPGSIDLQSVQYELAGKGEEESVVISIEY